MSSDSQPQKVRDKIENAIVDARRIFISDAFDSELAQEVIHKLWYMELKEPGKPILLVINSPGGQTDSGFAIWDQAKMISSPVTTLITGLAASFGSIISLVAPPGKRFATPHARIMIHQPLISGVMKGQATDIEITAKEMLKTRELLVDIYTEATGRPREEIDKAVDRDRWMSPKEAIEFGILDRIITSFAELN